MNISSDSEIDADRLGRIGELLTRDYCPRWSRYLTWARDPLAILAAAALCSSLCGLYLHPQGFMLAIGIAAVVAAGVAWPRLSVAGMRGSLEFDKARVIEGDPVVARVVLRNRAPWGARGVAIGSGLDGEGRDVGVSCVPARGSVEATWEFVPRQRGEYPGVDPTIATGFPFGLRTATRGLSVEAPVLAWPRTFPVGPIPVAAPGRGSAGTMHRDRVGDTGDVLGLRHYRRGDPLRRVHWPQTARQGRLIVCELQAEALPRAQVVLDVDPVVHAGSGPRSSREWAIRIAASFLSGWVGHGADVDAIVDGVTVAPAGRSAPARRAGFLDALARIGPGATTTLAEALDLPACRESVGLRVVITTDIALGRLGPRCHAGTPERFIVLEAAAFGDPGARLARDPASSPIRPWALVDDPGRVAQIIRRAWKEGPRGR